MSKTYYPLGPDGRANIESRLLRYLGTWSEGLSTARMSAWIQSCIKGGGYTFKEYDTALYSLRASGKIGFANGIWYVRKAIR